MINKGDIINGVYVKHCDFSKAVLWKDRQLSVPEDVFRWIVANRVTKMVFRGTGSIKEVWIFSVMDVLKNKTLRCVGQEPQYYFPIHLDVSDSKISHRGVNNEC